MAVFSQKHELLDLACQLTQNAYEEETPNVTFTVTPATINHVWQTDKWPEIRHQKDGYGNMDWEKIYDRQDGKTKRFLCAIHTKRNSELVGLFAGRISPDDQGGAKVSIDYIERNSATTVGKGHVMAIAIKFAYVLADALEYCIVKVNNPAKGLIEKYKNEMPNAEFVFHSKHHTYLQAPVITHF
ncbi:hypothetical protein GNP89_19455 [Aliivibrio fischeri]|uniref:hypothetical protein n=1 Tax=Aliivibrio fischeri TaxID=668 RepID=UPI0012D8C6E3|nr:hypothetical protein [Aliivibrio fischeri]MUL04343.1 hypothetical protein [Aliivibrio fischeri]